MKNKGTIITVAVIALALLWTKGFDTTKAELLVDKTVFFALESPASVRVELVKADYTDEELLLRNPKK